MNDQTIRNKMKIHYIYNTLVLLVFPDYSNFTIYEIDKIYERSFVYFAQHTLNYKISCKRKYKEANCLNKCTSSQIQFYRFLH